jgi:pyruvate dehydrogenase phosphatase
MACRTTYSRSESFPLPGVHISVVQYQPTKRPIEDRFSVHSSQGRLVVGVYDGHGGAATAEHISKFLPERIIQKACKQTDYAQIFTDLDTELISKFTKDHAPFRTRSHQWVENAQVIRAGSTALILDIDMDKLSVQFANAGDCRAVVWNPSGPGIGQTLDLNAKTPSEHERLQREHPGEDLLIVSGRLFGKLMSTRGFGDGYYKLPKGRQHKKYIDILSSLPQDGKIALNEQYLSYFYGYKTPPYLTATPEYGTLPFERGGFIIVATDGLWDLVWSEEAASIVSEGVAAGVEDLSGFLLRKVMESKTPGDDITIIVVRA